LTIIYILLRQNTQSNAIFNKKTYKKLKKFFFAFFIKNKKNGNFTGRFHIAIKPTGKNATG